MLTQEQYEDRANVIEWAESIGYSMYFSDIKFMGGKDARGREKPKGDSTVLCLESPDGYSITVQWQEDGYAYIYNTECFEQYDPWKLMRDTSIQCSVVGHYCDRTKPYGILSVQWHVSKCEEMMRKCDEDSFTPWPHSAADKSLNARDNR